MFNKNKYTKSNGPKNKQPCVNPVFEKWIMELREDAIARDTQSKHTYLKCLNSLRKYPMQLNTGKECVILEGFGAKICKLIDEKLESFISDGGILHELEESIVLGSSSEDSDDEIILELDKVEKSNNRGKSSTQNEVISIGSESSSDALYLDMASTSSLIEKHKKNLYSFSKTPASRSLDTPVQKQAESAKSVTKTRKKEYMPEPRSGPHAILITLLDNETNGENKNEEGVSFMLKADLISQAQPHCKSDFISADSSNRFTAWNSMSGLIKKNMVYKTNNLPAKYMLTDEGREVAVKLVFGTETCPESDSDDSERIESIPKVLKVSQDHTLTETISYNINDVVNIEATVEKTNTNDLIEIISSDETDIDIISLMNECAASIKQSVNKVTTIDDDSSSDDELPDIGDFGGSSNFVKCQTVPTTTQRNLSNIKNKKQTKPASKQNKDLAKQDSIISLTQDFQQLKSSSSDDVDIDLSKPTSSKFDINKYKGSSSSLSQKETPKKDTNLSNFSMNKFTKKTSNLSAGQKPTALFTYQAGTYDVMLFVDNCEQTAKKQDILIEELRKSKIKFDIGKLNVGDFTWIARPKSCSAASDRDIILDCLLERKRMDDFCSSILDGRYKEQKFRLKKSGITKKIYLIEDHGSMKHMSLPEKSLVQADVNTQIIDHLVVHHTTDPKDTAHYLIEMTKYMTRTHQGIDLNACVKEDLDEFNSKITDKSLFVNYFMTLKEFNAFSNKNKPLTLKEMFAKCLMKVQGLSQEKCMAIIEQYPTVEALMKAYSAYPDAKREKMLANLKYGSQQRNVGPSLSKLIAQLFYTTSSLT